MLVAAEVSEASPRLNDEHQVSYHTYTGSPRFCDEHYVSHPGGPSPGQ